MAYSDLNVEQIEQCEQAFNELKMTWDLAQLSPEDVFQAGFAARLESEGVET
jgi:hypothetical protein